MFTRRACRYTLTLIALLISAISASYCQDVTLQNAYIGVAIGTSGFWEDPPHAIGDAAISGRFQIWNTGGDPTTDGDDGMSFNYPSGFAPAPGDKWGAWELIMETTTVPEDEEEIPVSSFSNFIWGDSEAGTWSVSPYIPRDENVIRAVWYPSTVVGDDPGSDPANIAVGKVRCELEAKLMRDMVRFKWTLKNEGTSAVRVGMKSYADVTPNPEDSGTQDLRNIVSIPGYPLLQNPVVLFNKDIPSVLEMFDSRDEPTISLRMMFDGQNATRPDVVGVDEWATIAGASWNYTRGIAGRPYYDWTYEPITHLDISDIGYGAIWKPQTLSPGQTRTIINYLGIGCSTSDFTKPNINYPQYVASVQGPRCLTYFKSEDMPNIGGTGQLGPSPFTISAYMMNTEKNIDLTNATFSLILPDSLMLADSENGKYTKTQSVIKAGMEGTVSWQVIPVGTPTGIQKYSVSMSADPVGGTTVTREINIPATENQPLRSGMQMISVPFNFTDPDPESALGLFPGFRLWKFDASSNAYSAVEKLVPGEAYWLSLQQGQNTFFTSESNPIQWAGTHGYSIPLKQGWNLFGNPYIFSVTMGETRFYTRDYGVVSYDTAVEKRLINPTVFSWDTTYRRYNYSSKRSAEIRPWQGYWLRVLKPGVTMFITPVSQVGAKLGGVPLDDDGTIPSFP